MGGKIYRVDTRHQTVKYNADKQKAVNEPDHVDQSASVPDGPGDVALVARPTEAWERLLSAIRGRGFSARLLPLEQFHREVDFSTPLRVVLIDLDEPETIDGIEEAAELALRHGLVLAYLGDAKRASVLAQHGAPGEVFSHPIQMKALMGFIAEAAFGNLTSHVRESSLPDAIAHKDTAPPPTHDSDAPQLIEFPAALPPPDLESILSMNDDALRLPSDLPTQLSPELDQLMLAAELRVEQMGRPSSLPPPDELDVPLSSEWVSVLEPLEGDESEELHTLHGPPSGLGPPSLPRPSGLTDAFPKPSPPVPPTPKPASKREQKTTERPPHKAQKPEPPELKPTLPPPNSIPRRPPHPPDSVRSSRAIDRTLPTKPPPSRASHPGEATAHMPFPPSGFGGAPTVPVRSEHRPTHAPPPSLAKPSGDANSSQPAHTSSSGKQPISPPPQAQRSPASKASSSVEEPATTFPSPMGTPSRPMSLGPREPQPAPPSVKPPAHPQETAPPPVRVPAPEPAKAPPQQAQLLVFSPEGDAMGAIAQAIAQRRSGGLVFSAAKGGRTLVLWEGDFVTAASSVSEESLAAYLVARGDLRPDVLNLPLAAFGKRACSALVAKGHLTQDDLWPTLRAHAEWLIGLTLSMPAPVTCTYVTELSAALRNEPTVFGGAAGAEIFVEAVRRVIEPQAALAKLGGESAIVDMGPHRELLSECNLATEDIDKLRHGSGRRAGEILEGRPAEMAAVLLALKVLGVITTLTAAPKPSKEEDQAPEADPYDEEAVRRRVKARLALVEDADYFALLGLPRHATAYDIKRAYLDLRRGFEPTRLLTATTADLRDDLRLILDVLDEAYDILRDPHRRERYRRAIESPGPS